MPNAFQTQLFVVGKNELLAVYVLVYSCSFIVWLINRNPFTPPACKSKTTFWCHDRKSRFVHEVFSSELCIIEELRRRGTNLLWSRDCWTPFLVKTQHNRIFFWHPIFVCVHMIFFHLIFILTKMAQVKSHNFPDGSGSVRLFFFQSGIHPLNAFLNSRSMAL